MAGMRSFLVVALSLIFTLVFGCGGATSTPGAAGSAAGPAAGPGATATHAIRLHRPLHVGDSFVTTLQARNQTRQLVTVNGVPRGDTAPAGRSILLIANVVIRSVNAHGKPTLTEYTVQECTTGGDAPRTILPAGSVVLVTAREGAEDGTITLQGGQLTEEQTKQLDLVMSTHIAGGTDDAIFGTTAPQAIGASWPMNAAEAAQDLSRMPSINIAAHQIRGGATLVGLEDTDGVPCQRIEAAMQAQGFTISGFPEGATMRSASLELRMSAAFPLDTSLQKTRDSIAMTMHAVVQLPAPPGATALLTIDVNNSKTMQLHP